MKTGRFEKVRSLNKPDSLTTGFGHVQCWFTIAAVATASITMESFGMAQELPEMLVPERGIVSALSAKQWIEQWEKVAHEKSPKVKSKDGKFFWTQPWMAGFLSGNGILGVIDHAEPLDETITICHEKLFLPNGEVYEIEPELGGLLPGFRQVLKDKGYEEANRWRMREWAKRGYKGAEDTAFHMGFQLKINTPPQGQVRDYLRTCDFASNELAYQWTDEGGRHAQRLFVSRPDNAIVLVLEGPRPGGLNCAIYVPSIARQVKEERSIKNKSLIDPACTVGDGMIVLDNRYTKPTRGLAPAAIGGYAAVVQVLPKGGRMRTVGDQIHVEGADGVLVLMKLEPYAVDEKNVRGVCVRMQQQIGVLARKGYDTLLAAHAKQHGSIFSRVALDLGGAEQRNLPVEQLLDRALAQYEIPPSLFASKDVFWKMQRVQIQPKEYEIPPALFEKMYDASRYLFMCSGPGELPPTVQGIWNEGLFARWQGGYCFDTNVQLDMASALSANMAEDMMSLFDAIEKVWMPGWRLSARKLWGCRGIQGHTRGQTSGVNLGFANAFFMGVGAWMAHFYYDYYLYTLDRDFLEKRAVPFMKEVALFYEDFLKDSLDENGNYLFSPSFSPEAGGNNATMEIAAAKEVLRNLIQASEVVSIDKADVARWQAMLAKMPPYLIDREDGSLKEFAVADSQERHTYRCSSHLYPVRWSHEFSAEKTPELWKAAQIAEVQRVEHTELGQSWLHTWAKLGLSAASLGMGDTAYDCIRRYLWERFVFPNLTMSHGGFYETFAFDANGALPEIVNRMLLHSWDGTLYLLPALPKYISTGRISGIRARGNFEVDLAWKDGRVRRVTVRSKSGNVARLVYTGIADAQVRDKDEKPVTRRSDGPNKLEFDTQQGREYVIETRL